MSGSFGPPIGIVQQPRLRITANGQIVPSPIEAHIMQTNTWTAATWSASIALQDTDAMNAEWWGSQDDVRIEIDFSLDNGQSFPGHPQFEGIVDEIELDTDANIVHLGGRDFTALLIDNKSPQAYQNQTSSEIAAKLAGSVGLKVTDSSGASTITATTTPVGEYYASNSVRMTSGYFARSITQWDLLVFLAQQEGFDVFVQGQTLYFQPPASASTPAFQVYHQRSGGTVQSNVIGLRGRRSLTLAKDVTVTVKSWNSYQRRAYTVNASKAGSKSSAVQNYVFYQPNLSIAQAQALANQKLAEITRHERVIEFSCAPELNLTPHGVIQLSGTGTAFDQLYYPDEITRSFSFQGASMSVTARNHSPVEQVALQTGANGPAGGLQF